MQAGRLARTVALDDGTITEVMAPLSDFIVSQIYVNNAHTETLDVSLYLSNGTATEADLIIKKMVTGGQAENILDKPIDLSVKKKDKLYAKRGGDSGTMNVKVLGFILNSEASAIDRQTEAQISRNLISDVHA